MTYYHSDPISLDEFLSMRIKVQNFILFLGLLFAWQVIFSAFGVYHSRRLTSRVSESLNVLKASSLGTLSIYLAAFLFNMSMIGNAANGCQTILNASHVKIITVMLEKALPTFNVPSPDTIPIKKLFIPIQNTSVPLKIPVR